MGSSVQQMGTIGLLPSPAQSPPAQSPPVEAQSVEAVLTLGARLIDHDLALKIVDRWLNTSFSGGHHAQRVEKIAAIERAEKAKT